MRSFTKFNCLAALTILTVANVCVVHASEDGGNHSGGGLHFTSSTAEIQKAVNDVALDLQALDFFTGRFQLFNPEIAPNALLKKAFMRLRDVQQRCENPDISCDSLVDKPVSRSGFGLKDEADFLLHATPKKFVVKEECFDSQHQAKDSATEFKRGAEICYSRKALTVLGPDDLRLQVMALTVHEILHHFQGTPKDTTEAAAFELEAMELQNFVIQNFRRSFHSFEINNLSKSGSYAIAPLKVEATVIAPDGYVTIPVMTQKAGKVLASSIRVDCVAYDTGIFFGTEGFAYMTNKGVSDRPPGIILGPGEYVRLAKRSHTPSAVYCMNIKPLDCKMIKNEGANRGNSGKFDLQIGDYITNHERAADADEFWGLKTKEDAEKIIAKYRIQGVCK